MMELKFPLDFPFISQLQPLTNTERSTEGHGGSPEPWDLPKARFGRSADPWRPWVVHKPWR
jgi:hypothetical protein